MFRVLILEDDVFTLEKYKKIVDETFFGCDVYTATNGVQALKVAANHSLDLMLTDIVLKNNEIGLSVVNQIKNIQPEMDVIVITANSDYLKESLTLNPYYYFMKPIDELFLSKKLNEWLLLKKKVTDQAFKTLTLVLDDEVVIVPLKHIYYFEKKSRYIKVKTLNKSFTVKGSLKDTFSKLDNRFCVSHQSFIVNKTKISDVSIQEDRNRTIRFKDLKDEVPLSRYKAKEFFMNLLEFSEDDEF
ncbi:MAG: response regulator transcription factor [Clostridiales bacterium]|nr:response regulator transcription factor [Clostridiales bacterium]